MNVCIFLKEIEVEFTAFINDNNNLDGKKRFIVNNLLASYLHTHFEHTFRHITFRQYGWVASDNLVIDFYTLKPILCGEKDLSFMMLLRLTRMNLEQ